MLDTFSISRYSQIALEFLNTEHCEVEMCMGTGFPMGMRIPWECHGNGNKKRNWEWEWEGIGKHFSGNGITCTPMGIYSHIFFAAFSLLSTVYNAKGTMYLNLKYKAESDRERF